ncbi:hypothetical protein ACFL6H_03540 [Candidatus Latescibacterota bacterium]
MVEFGGEILNIMSISENNENIDKSHNNKNKVLNLKDYIMQR